MDGRKGRGIVRAGGAGDLRDGVEASGFADSQVRMGSAVERWELGFARWGSRRSGGLP